MRDMQCSELRTRNSLYVAVGPGPQSETSRDEKTAHWYWVDNSVGIRCVDFTIGMYGNVPRATIWRFTVMYIWINEEAHRCVR
jgi:hypothetical protein